MILLNNYHLSRDTEAPYCHSKEEGYQVQPELSEVLKFSTFAPSLEVKLAEIAVVSLLNCDISVEIKECCTSEVDFPWVIDESIDDKLLCTAAAACHL